MITGMAEVADVLATYLQTQGIGTIGTDLYIDWMPDKVDVLTSVYRLPGEGPSYVMNRGYPVNNSRAQIVTRGLPADARSPRQKIADVAALLHSLVGVTLSGMRFIACSATDDPHLLERDSKERCTYTQFWEVVHEV